MGSGKWGVGNGEWEMGSGVLPHERLEAWKQGMGLVKAIYEITKGFPREEMFGLTQQMPGYINEPPQLTQTMNHVGRFLTGLHKKWSNP
jgi:hypothetical protein